MGLEDCPNSTTRAVDIKKEDIIASLLKAVDEGDSTALKSLISSLSSKEDRDAYITAKDSLGCTALHDAARCKSLDVATLLIENVADKNGYITAKNTFGCTALHHAARDASLRMVELLMENTVDKNEFIDVPDSRLRTALHEATAADKGGIILRLLREGADPKIQDGQRQTAWDIAVCKKRWTAIAALMLKENDKKIVHDNIPNIAHMAANDMVSVNAQLCTITRRLQHEDKTGHKWSFGNDWPYNDNIELMETLGTILHQVRREFHEDHEAAPHLGIREPSCVVQPLDETKHIRNKSMEFISLVMPFIHVDNVTFGERKNKRAGQTENLKYCVSEHRTFLEGYMPLTLDEYCSPALSQKVLDFRNDDQVLGRYERSRRNKHDTVPTGPETSENESSLFISELLTLASACLRRLGHLVGIGETKRPNTLHAKGATAEGSSFPVSRIFIRQAWIWVIRDHTIATSMQEPLPWELKRRLYDIKENPQLSIALLLSNLVEPFDNPTGEATGQLLKMYANELSVISEGVNQYVNRALIEDIDIEQEKKFIHEIDDLREELSMIKSVLAEQEEVWRDFISLMWPGQGPDRPQENILRSAGDGPTISPGQPVRSAAEVNISREIWRPHFRFKKHRRRILKLEEDAERVERNISTQLDLKKQHAEMKVAHSTAVISAAVFGFTIITIIFVPLSFIVALFALPIDEFNKGKKGNEADGVYSSSYIGKWSATTEIVSITVTLGAMWATLRFAGLHLWGKKGLRDWIRQRANDIRAQEKQSQHTPQTPEGEKELTRTREGEIV